MTNYEKMINTLTIEVIAGMLIDTDIDIETNDYEQAFDEAINWLNSEAEEG